MDLRKANDVSVDPSAFRVSELCPLSDVYALFDLIRCNRVFVVSYGKICFVFCVCVRRIEFERRMKALLCQGPQFSLFFYTGVLVGVISRRILIENITHLNDKPATSLFSFGVGGW